MPHASPITLRISIALFGVGGALAFHNNQFHPMVYKKSRKAGEPKTKTANYPQNPSRIARKGF